MKTFTKVIKGKNNYQFLKVSNTEDQISLALGRIKLFSELSKINGKLRHEEILVASI